MTQPTMVTSDGQLHVGRLETTVWQAAVDRLAGQDAQGADDDALAGWRAAGIVDEDLAVAPDWRRAIDAQARASAGLTIVGRMGEVAFLTTLHLCPALGDAVAVTLRATADGQGNIDFIHPMAEVALAPSERPWTLLRRVLPPLDVFRADPETSRAEPAVLPLGPEEQETAQAAAASVFAFGTHVASGRSREAIWYLGGDQLHRLSPAAQEVLAVEAGDVGAGLLRICRELMSEDA